MAEEVRLTAIVHGYVQGVGFRYFAQRRAASLGLKGYVRNRWDGTVEVVAEGPRAAVDQLRAILEEGPVGAYVERVDAQQGLPTGEFATFQIRF
jgi:acylphosphatase